MGWLIEMQFGHRLLCIVATVPLTKPQHSGAGACVSNGRAHYTPVGFFLYIEPHN